MVSLFKQDYLRELNETKPRNLPLNQLFVGNPGKGKTTAPALYGRILVDLGLLSKGDGKLFYYLGLDCGACGAVNVTDEPFTSISGGKPVRFEDFSFARLEQILLWKISQQETACSSDAIQVAKDMLERALTRPNFGNASEVERCLSIAKLNYEKRQYKAVGCEDASQDEEFLPEDFDLEHKHRHINCHELLAEKLDDQIIEPISSFHVS
ncbi:hypothetical protein TSTA_057890 [Talaromyces stipitatus ATCC 10500]|uniref:Uncharacterized protein n=1 Tax=Talaromyces stipitatus (strain ATCC 10500 / CBS 375.48 / QM 6759 / NRRL 1006) TaxID=441959 RepID=B8MRW6_TALSN|nr:uncharacterized protein TSTA_057890 [Talaromyces stipitatus ATCC 10500]EED13300.1 hypothetical protein TSTA_057890 [Talaromyces stipitatus ATCC 10500]